MAKHRAWRRAFQFGAYTEYWSGRLLAGRKSVKLGPAQVGVCFVPSTTLAAHRGDALQQEAIMLHFVQTGSRTALQLCT